MDRRNFLKGLVSLPLAAALPASEFIVPTVKYVGGWKLDEVISITISSPSGKAVQINTEGYMRITNPKMSQVAWHHPDTARVLLEFEQAIDDIKNSWYFKIVYETGSGKYVSLTSPSGYTSSKHAATEFMNLIDFYDQTEGDTRYKLNTFESHAAPEHKTEHV